MSKIADALIARPGHKVRLSDLDPSATPGCKNRAEAERRTAKNIDRLAVLQHLLYAEGRRSVLVILQGIDAGGKDGTIRSVMGGLNPQGTRVTSFKAPSAEERGHDYLWRVHKACPGAGEVGIFNRSHYEEVLIVRVHNLVPPAVWKKRYAHINEFERMLTDCGTKIVKFFLSISKDEQKERFEERLSDKTKNWKFNPEDLKERAYWDDYQKAFTEAIERCSTEYAPWHIIPANRKWYRNLAVSEILADSIEGLNLKYPKPTADLKKIQFE